MPETDISACVDVISAGGVIVHATEGVFGLACSIDFPAAIDKITALKGRDPNAKPYLVLVGHISQVTRLVSLDVPCATDIKASWPGPYTWVFPRKLDAYPWLGGPDGSLAIRFTAHPQAQRLAALAGPLVSTSANPHGAQAATTIAAAQQYFSNEVEFYLDGELQTPGRPSEIRDAVSDERFR